MRYCPGCKRINEGWPERCRFCASTWGVRICKRGHPNPVNAVFCGECGSAEMSAATGGGGLWNRIFWLCRGDGSWFRYLLKIAVVAFAFMIVIMNLEAVAPFLIAIGLLFAAFRFLSQHLPLPLLKFIGRVLRYSPRRRKTRSNPNDRRGR